MGAEWTDCKEIVLNRLKGSGLEVQQAPELIQTLAGWLFRNPNLTLPEINNELKYTKWRGFQLNEQTWTALVNCLRYEGMKGLEYRLGLGFFRLDS